MSAHYVVEKSYECKLVIRGHENALVIVDFCHHFLELAQYS